MGVAVYVNLHEMYEERGRTRPDLAWAKHLVELSSINRAKEDVA